MNREELTALINEAGKEAITYPDTDLKKKLKRYIKKVLKYHYYPRDLINWPNALLALSLIENNAAKEVQQEFLDQWIKEGKKVRGVENAIAGKVFLDMGTPEGDEAATYIFNYLINEAKDYKGSFIYNPNKKEEYVFVDMLGMICPFMAEYGRKKGNEIARKLSEIQLKNFIKFGIDEDSGLPFHAYEYKSFEKLGLVGWGRAVGWLMMGEAGYLEYTPAGGEYYDRIIDHFIKFTDTVFEYQNEDGLFGWKLAHGDVRADTSSTAMILNATLSGIVDSGVLDKEKYADKIRLGFEGLKVYAKGGKVYEASAESLGLGIHPDIYGAYPWSLGPFLSLVSRIDKL